MVYLNFTDLSEEEQNRLLENSKKDVERKFGESLRKYIKENHTCFELWSRKKQYEIYILTLLVLTLKF